MRTNSGSRSLCHLHIGLLVLVACGVAALHPSHVAAQETIVTGCRWDCDEPESMRVCSVSDSTVREVCCDPDDPDAADRPQCVCYEERKEIERLLGRNRGLEDAAKAIRRAQQRADRRRYDALGSIYGSQGSAARFIESLAQSLPGAKGTYGKVLEWTRTAGGIVVEGEGPSGEDFYEWLKNQPKSLTTDQVLERIHERLAKKIEREAHDYYRRTGDARGAYDDYIRRSRALRNAMNNVGSILAFKGLYQNGNDLAGGILDWVEAKRDYDRTVRELKDIDQRIEANNRKIEQLREQCEEKRTSEPVSRLPGRISPYDSWARHFHPDPSAIRFALATAPETAGPRAWGMSVSSRDRWADSRSTQELDMAAALTARHRLLRLRAELSSLIDFLAREVYPPLLPYLFSESWLGLPIPLHREFLARTEAALEEALSRMDRALRLGVLVPSDLGLDVDTFPQASSLGQVEKAEAPEAGPPTGAMVLPVAEEPWIDQGILRRDDVILSWDGHDVEDDRHLARLLSGAEPGREIPVTVKRDGQEEHLTVPVGRPAHIEDGRIVRTGRLETGQSFEDELVLPGEAHSYRFEAEAGDRVRIRTSPECCGKHPRIELYDDAGQRLARVQGEVLEHELEAGGRFHVLLYFHGADTGAYGIHLQRLNVPAGAAPIAFGQTVGASVGERAEVDAYRFEAEAGDRVRIRTSPECCGKNPRIELYDDAGQRLARVQGEVLEHELEAGGRFHVLLYFHGADTGTYDLRLRRLD